MRIAGSKSGQVVSYINKLAKPEAQNVRICAEHAKDTIRR